MRLPTNKLLLLLYATSLFGQFTPISTGAYVAPLYISVCNLARLLQSMGESIDDIPNWICLAQTESKLNIKAISAGNYGLFQIKSNGWCAKSGKGGLCNAHCDHLAYNDPRDQIRCALKVRDTFCYWEAWPSWLSRCHGKDLPSVKVCFKNLGDGALDGNTTVDDEWQEF